MTGKLAIAFVLGGVMIASAKSYTISFEHPAMVANTMLKAGEYRLQLEGSQVVLKNLSNHTALQAAVKIENANRKFQSTEIETRDVNGKTELQQIHLGGTTTILEFNN